uniref:Small auxin up regulated protein n=1 Tax=Kalanchoe fedtschenkoi TaxID=63787 RepID=A0A7N0TDC5_KALFE
MGIHLQSMIRNAKQICKVQALISSRNQAEVPKGHVAVYVGEIQMKRFVVPVTYLNHPSFVALLKRAEEEFGYNHPMGALTIPCREDTFIDLTSRLNIIHSCDDQMIELVLALPASDMHNV